MNFNCNYNFFFFEKKKKKKIDKFDMNEKDPLKSGAMESSLWELNVIFL